MFSKQLSGALPLLTFTQMWESFSFFGMRVLLVLYLVSSAGFSPQDAFVLYTLYISFVKLGAGLGGYIVDRYLKYREGVAIGSAFIAAGHFLLTFESVSALFYLGLGSIICGSSLFRVSLQSLVGLLPYEGNPDKAFNLLYVRMNIGGLLAAILCGLAAQTFGWHAGFGLAALGMVFGLVLFVSNRGVLKNLEPAKPSAIPFVCCLGMFGSAWIALFLSHYALLYALILPLGIVAFCYVIYLLGKQMDRSIFPRVLGALGLLIAFTVAEELWGSLLMLFSENHVSRLFFGMEIPSAAIAATNPLTIILLGPFIANRNLPYASKASWAFLFLAGAFFILFALSKVDSPSFVFLVMGLMAIALGEVLLTPSVLSFASQHAPQDGLGLMMGTTTLALAIGSLLSGEVAKLSLSPDLIFIGIGLGALLVKILISK